jgi:predicted choloylglycine hydrolase
MSINLQEERKADYQTFEAAGTHYAIGLETARHAGKQFGPPDGWSTEQRKFAEKCRVVVNDLYPEMIEEFKGYAEGLGTREDELLWHYTLGVTGGCSGIALRTPGGMFVGRNYDFFYWENRRHLICTRPDIGFAHIGMHEGLVGGRFDGLNEKGLYVSFNGAGPHPDPASPGMSFHLIVRYLLEKCSDAREAQEALLTLPVKEPKSYLVVDGEDAFVAEVHPEKRAVRRMEGDVLMVTNHFKDASMVDYMREWPNSVSRYRKLEEHAARIIRNADNEASDQLRQALRDHDAPVCGHEDGLATFWSCIADLQGRRISYSLGAPCRNEYKEYYVF